MNKNESKYFNTAKKMNDALIALLETKEYEYITIKEICNIANVNRSTFYLHYSNMNDLLEETIKSLSLSFNSHFKSKENESTIISKDNLEDLLLINDDNLIPYLNFIKENTLRRHSNPKCVCSEKHSLKTCEVKMDRTKRKKRKIDNYSWICQHSLLNNW